MQKEFNAVKEKYINTDEWLKAPNGKDTNLSEHLWVMVRTPRFKKWFGDIETITFNNNGKIKNIPDNVSKVVDDNGEPKIIFHGTTHGFNEFTKERGNIENWFGNAYYFSDSELDVNENYLSTGSDLTNRIELLAERIEQTDEISFEEAKKKHKKY